MRVDVMDDSWVHNKSYASDVPCRALLSVNNQSPVIELSYVDPSALGFLQCDHMEFYAICSIEKNTENGIGVDCSRVVSLQHKTISMSCT